MLYAINAIAWATLSGAGGQLYRTGELDTTGEIVLAVCVGMFVWNLFAAITG
jgi:hypothetical protein